MEIILSVAISIDGCLDDSSPQRLKLSSAEDWEAVQRLRATCDAILVGARTVRSDNPSLVIRNEEARRWRVSEGMEADIVKVTITASGDIDPDAAFFLEGGGRKIVFAVSDADRGKLALIARHAEVIEAAEITPEFIRDALAARGCRRLMVEGGGEIITMFLRAGVVDRLRLAIAPFLIGDPTAPRMVGGGAFPYDKDNRMRLENVEMLGDMAVMNYEL
jgi:5-amino-6-(5-phosphoribosylamino)uracil reductase